MRGGSIQAMFKESVAIDQIMVVGEHEKFASAIISPNFKYFDELRSANKISFSDNKELIQLPEIQSFFSSEINNINKKLNHAERINRFRLVPDEWSPATGELSPTLKLKRHFITDKYSNLIDQVYMK
jgi:long-chain acyl-CoA synthetase